MRYHKNSYHVLQMTPIPHLPGSLHKRLREATQASHLGVERHPLLAPLMHPELDQHSYIRVLQAFRRFYQACEPGLTYGLIAGTEAGSVQYRYQPRSQLLAEDLHDLSANGFALAVEPDVPGSSVLQTPEHILGWLYVLEGATQGGRVIAPRVSRALGLNGTFGARYFHLYTRNNWRRFQTLMETCQGSYCQSKVVNGAIAAFENLLAHLNAGNTTERA